MAPWVSICLSTHGLRARSLIFVIVFGARWPVWNRPSSVVTSSRLMSVSRSTPWSARWLMWAWVRRTTFVSTASKAVTWGSGASCGYSSGSLGSSSAIMSVLRGVTRFYHQRFVVTRLDLNPDHSNTSKACVLGLINSILLVPRGAGGVGIKGV